MKSTPPTTKCFAHYHMTAKEYGFWDVCRSLSHETGILYFNGRGIASRFKGMQKTTAYELADSLSQSGWFKLLKDSARRSDGMFSPRQYQVLSHAEWAAEHPDQCDQPVRSDGLDNDSPVRSADYPVRSADQPVRSGGHNLIETLSDRNPPDRKPDYQAPVRSGGLEGFVERFSKRRRPEASAKAAAPKLTAQPVRDSGQGERDTQREAERLATAIANTLGLAHPETRASWNAGVKALLDKGHPPELVQSVAEYAHAEFGPVTMTVEKAAGFVQHFDGIAEHMRRKRQQEGAMNQ
ncbi:MAG TPA: hypothetical protein VFA60_01110 [Terriglobales bacterium]|nr:hypothetical protein [Terriglobales bacterium]